MNKIQILINAVGEAIRNDDIKIDVIPDKLIAAAERELKAFTATSEALTLCIDELSLHEKIARQTGDSDLLIALKKARKAKASLKVR